MRPVSTIYTQTKPTKHCNRPCKPSTKAKLPVAKKKKTARRKEMIMRPWRASVTFDTARCVIIFQYCFFLCIECVGLCFSLPQWPLPILFFGLGNLHLTIF